MIFNVPGHIDMIRNGLKKHPPISHIPPRFIVKTQARGLNRGIYQVGRDYAVQRERGAKAEPDIRIVMDEILKEEVEDFVDECEVVISQENAWAEGGYTPTEFEEVFANLNPEWLGWTRWAFEFYVVEVKE